MKYIIIIITTITATAIAIYIFLCKIIEKIIDKKWKRMEIYAIIVISLLSALAGLGMSLGFIEKYFFRFRRKKKGTFIVKGKKIKDKENGI